MLEKNVLRSVTSFSILRTRKRRVNASVNNWKKEDNKSRTDINKLESKNKREKSRKVKYDYLRSIKLTNFQPD